MKRAHFSLVWLMGLALLLACGGGESDTAGETVEAPETAVAEHEGGWLDYETGMARAAEGGKYVVIDFWTSWCHWCKVMDRETYTDDEVKRRLEDHFVMVKVDAESAEAQGADPTSPTGRELAREFRVSSYPTTWFVDSQGEKIAPLPGYVEPKQFVQVLDYISSGSYQNQSFQEYQSARQGG